MARPSLRAGTLYLVFISLYLVPYHENLSALVCVPQKWVGQGPFRAIHLCLSTDGYDGAYYYAIAQNPFHIPTNFIDQPGMRHGRLLYPLLAWLVSGGDAERLLWTMPLLNFVAVLGLACLGCKIAMHFERSAWWGLLLTIGVNAYMPALRDLTDTLATTTAVGLIASWLLRWPSGQLLGWGIACVMSREQNIAIAALVLLETLLEKDIRRSLAAGAAAGVWGGWIAILLAIYGKLPMGPDNMAAPFVGLDYAWTHVGTGLNGARNPLPHCLRMSLLSAQTFAGLTILPRGFRTAGLLGLGAAILTCIAGTAIFADAWGYMRVLNWAPLAVWLWSVQSGRRWPAALLAPALAWPVINIVRVWHLNGLIMS